MADETQDDFQEAFWNAKKTLAEASEIAYRRHGVHAGQQFILRQLWREDGLTPGQIARRLDLATPTVTKMTTRMAAAGLVARGPHPTDRRLVRINLTERGRGLEGAISREIDQVTEHALRSLEPEDRARFMRYLGEVCRNLADRVSVPTVPSGAAEPPGRS